jgi:hypothetical protein
VIIKRYDPQVELTLKYREEAGCPACYGVLRYSQRPTLSRMDDILVLTLRGWLPPTWFRSAVIGGPRGRGRRPSRVPIGYLGGDGDDSETYLDASPEPVATEWLKAFGCAQHLVGADEFLNSQDLFIQLGHAKRMICR